MKRRLMVLALLIGGCNKSSVEDFHGPEQGLSVAPESVVGTVGDQVNSVGCSTSVVLGLSHQIADEINCISPNALSTFSGATDIDIDGGAVLTYLASDAVTALRAAAKEAGGIEVTSAFRTVPQQLLLYRWYLAGLCGIAIAATPGTSNHENARAVDLADWSSVLTPMADHGWAHDVPGDDVHFDHLASPDLSGRDVLAFQRLWNRNHPTDLIAADGEYGEDTESRLLQAPAAGFAIGACSSGTTVDDSQAQYFSVSGPWQKSTSVAGYVGADYEILAPGVNGWASWALPVAPGAYQVQVRYTPFANRNSHALYRVYTSSGATPQPFSVDQRTGGTITLGSFTLGAGAYVSLDPDQSDGYTIADAVIALPN